MVVCFVLCGKKRLFKPAKNSSFAKIFSEKYKKNNLGNCANPFLKLDFTFRDQEKNFSKLFLNPLNYQKRHTVFN